MNAEAATGFLELFLAPLAPFLARADVTDIYINRPEEIWTETLGGAIERHAVAHLDEQHLWQLARQIASQSNQGINRTHPLLAASLSSGERVQIIAPPATRGPMAIAIRKHVSSDRNLSDYIQDGGFDRVTTKTQINQYDKDLKALQDQRNWPRFLQTAVRARKTIIVSGGTSSGKTTFLNALLREVEPEERLILIEDTAELSISQQNVVGLIAVRGELGETTTGAEDLLTASLRMRPDRIILGELRGGEAFTFLRAANTGHPGSMTTIHANSAAHALEQVEMLVSRASGQGEDATRYFNTFVDIVVHVEREGAKRRIGEIMMPQGA